MHGTVVIPFLSSSSEIQSMYESIYPNWTKREHAFMIIVARFSSPSPLGPAYRAQGFARAVLSHLTAQ